MTSDTGVAQINELTYLFVKIAGPDPGNLSLFTASSSRLGAGD